MTPGAVEGAVLFRDRVDASAFLQTLSEKFAGQVGGVCHRVGPASRPLAHHSLHVFAVYPWFGLLRTGSNVPLSVLDQCRTARLWPSAPNARRPSGGRRASIAAGGPSRRRPGVAAQGLGLRPLTPAQVDALRRSSRRQMDLVSREGATMTSAGERLS